jgi:arginine utilization protein RocB
MTDSDQMTSPTAERALLGARAEYWARALTAIPSVTGSKDEADFAGTLVELLRASPAFEGKDAVWTVAVPGGKYPRHCVLALARGGASRRTMVLTGHFDTVETGCYGDIEPLALDPDRLAPALVERIAGEPFDARSARALDDLRGGGFLPGRGLLDMKAGLAAGLAAIEAMHRSGLGGNLLFVAVPDEEGNSAGARHMSQLLAAIAAEHDLQVDAVVNLDATVDDGDGEQGRLVALGSIGKMLPSALVVGRPAHAADSFRGFGAAALAGALAAEMEWAPELTERSGDELGAGPTLLGMKDDKTAYDVTMPASVWMYWNVMVHRRSPQAVLAAVEAAAERASARLAGELAARAKIAGISVAAEQICIRRFEDLHREVLERDARHRSTLQALAEQLAAADLSLPEQCRRLTEKIVALSGRRGPLIVLGFASIPYLPVELRSDAKAERLRRAALEAASATASHFGTTIGTIRYFPGISDLSFFGQGDDGQVETIAANTPAWRSILSGTARFGAANIPGINVGPWGRDYHTRLERIHVGYAFQVLPALILDIVRRFMAAA